MKLEDDNHTVSVTGLGFVGLTLSVFLADKGITVFGIEKDSQKLEKIKNGECSFFEEGLAEKLHKVVTNGNLIVGPTTDQFPSIAPPTLHFVTVGTPLVDGEPSMEYVYDAISGLSSWLSADSTIVLRSTVTPGTTELLEKHFAKVFPNVSYCFAPERTIEGTLYKSYQPCRSLLAPTTES